MGVFRRTEKRHMEKNLIKQDIYKAFSWRAIAMLITFAISIVFLGDYKLAAGIAVIDSIAKIVAYIYHEKLWREYG